MLLNEFGKKNKHTIVMIHGACMSWEMLLESADILKDDFHVICVAVPGHDEETKEEFTSIEEIAEQIEDALIRIGKSEIYLLYGLSVGGAIVLKMLANQRIYADRAVIDGGIAPCQYMYPATRAILAKDVLMAELAKHSRGILGMVFPKNRYAADKIDTMHRIMRGMTFKTIRRVFNSTDNYSLPETFPETSTVIEYWYGQREKAERRTDIEFVRNYIPGIIFREIPDMAHGQYALGKPKDFADDLKGECDYEGLTPQDLGEQVRAPMSPAAACGASAAAFAAIAVFASRCDGKTAKAVKYASTAAALGTGAMACWYLYEDLKERAEAEEPEE